MALDLIQEKGTPLDRQAFTWRELVQTPISKLDQDAFTRVRIILMNGIEDEAWLFQHHRYSALLDRLEGKDANNIVQSYTDIRPGRPTVEEHRDPMDDLREHYDHTTAHPLTKLNTLTILAGEQQTRNYYATVGNTFSDPIARQLYAEISSIEEQHVTQYECMQDPNETLMEKWLLHEATEVYNYYNCAQQETDGRIRAIWERMLDYELGHLQFVMDLFKQVERRDPAEVLPAKLPDTFSYKSHRNYVRSVLSSQVDLTSVGTQFVPKSEAPLDSPSHAYRKQMNSEGSPSELVAAGYRWMPGTELAARARTLRAKGHNGGGTRASP